MSLRTKALGWAVAASLVSVTGVALVMNHEGVRTRAYPDPGTGGAPWTICYGRTRGVRPGMTATLAQCESWLREDLLVAEQGIYRHVRVPLSQPEYDAYTSFIFNAGETNFARSTMLRKLNAGDRRGACNEFPKWVYANKKVMNGLIKRRYDEQTLCLKYKDTYVYVGNYYEAGVGGADMSGGWVAYKKSTAGAWSSKAALIRLKRSSRAATRWASSAISSARSKSTSGLTRKSSARISARCSKAR